MFILFLYFLTSSIFLYMTDFNTPFPILLQVLLIEGGNKRERSAVGSYTALIVCPLNGTRTITIALVFVIIIVITLIVCPLSGTRTITIAVVFVVIVIVTTITTSSS